MASASHYDGGGRDASFDIGWDLSSDGGDANVPDRFPTDDADGGGSNTDAAKEGSADSSDFDSTAEAAEGDAGPASSCHQSLVLPAIGSLASSEMKPSKNAIDDQPRLTWWESTPSGDQWLAVDLGARKQVREVSLYWQFAPPQYEIDLSDDASTWSIVYARDIGSTGLRDDDDSGFVGTGRYVRVRSTATTGPGLQIANVIVKGDDDPECGNLLKAGWRRDNVVTDFSPAAYTFGPGLNEITFGYLGQTFSFSDVPQYVKFTQSVVAPFRGSKWRFTLDVTAIKDQMDIAPKFGATLKGVEQTTGLPDTAAVTSRFDTVAVASLTRGAKAILDFDVDLASGERADVVLTNFPVFSGPAGLEAFHLVGASLLPLVVPQ
jgi:hypothetical protein